MKEENIYATHHNKYLKNCINCGHKVKYQEPDFLFCTQCSYPIRNECTGTAKYQDLTDLSQPDHNFENEREFPLEPSEIYCPKCSSLSLFARRGLIKNPNPKTELLPLKDAGPDLPF